jgi:hypothetical protein
LDTWITPALISAVVLLVTQAILFINWWYRNKRDSDIHRVFLYDVATNHLPHLYHGMKQLAKAQGIELEDPPPVQFIQFNGKHK